MRRVCAWCGIDLGTTVEGGDRLSHGICESCCQVLLAEDPESRLAAFLEKFSFPVLVVDEDVKILDGNDAALKLVGRRRSEVVGVRGGEVFECAFAKSPDGCGRSVHCKGCTIRNSVVRTFLTGEPVNAPFAPGGCPPEEAALADKRLTTWKTGGVVLLKLDH